MPISRWLVRCSATRPARRCIASSLPADVHALAVPAASDIVLFDEAKPFPHAQLACPLEVSHGHIASSAAAAAVVVRFLSGMAPTSCHPWQSWIADIGWGFRLP